MLNPPDILGWNADKRYLKDLADAGVRIIPTVFADRLSDEIITRARADFGHAVVLKPVVSAGAKNTLVFREQLTSPRRPAEGPSAPPAGRGDDPALHASRSSRKANGRSCSSAGRSRTPC